MVGDILKNVGPPNFRFNNANLGIILSDLLNIVFYLGTFLAFIWIAMAALYWLFSAGDKEKIAKSKARITYALVGLIIIILAFLIKNFVQDFLKPKNIPSPATISVLTTFVTPAYAASTDLGQIYGFGDITTLGAGISRFVPPIFSIAGIAIVMFFIYAGFRYLTSGGDKESVAKARSMIVSAITGFVVLLLTFLVLQFLLNQLFGITNIQLIPNLRKSP